MERNMNRDTYEALRTVGASEEQAIVLASAIPDIERPIAELRSDMERRFAEVDHKFELLSSNVNVQFARQRSYFLYGTLSIVGTLLTIVGTVVVLLQRAGLLS